MQRGSSKLLQEYTSLGVMQRGSNRLEARQQAREKCERLAYAPKKYTISMCVLHLASAQFGEKEGQRDEVEH